MKVHCLFEQSGTFKNEFRKLGYEANDYDIDNQFGQTDYQVDLFNEIRGGYEGNPSIFDNITNQDLVIAFFPCIRFSANVCLLFNENSINYRGMSKVDIIEQCRIYNDEQHELYQLVSKLFILAYRIGFRMIVENPCTQPHFLTHYFPIKASLIDKDRTILGDYFTKPTQYWFINCEPMNNKIKYDFIFGERKLYNNVNRRYYESPELNNNELSTSIKRSLISPNNNELSTSIKRSLISPKYAENFIKKYILEGEKKE